MNYTSLVAAILDFLNRNDDEALPVATFIRLIESRMNRTIRVRDMERRVSATISEQFSTLPNDLLQMRNIQVNKTPITALVYVTPQEADRINQGQLDGPPKFFSVVGNRLELIPAPSEPIEVEMVYYSLIPALGDEQETNWLLTKYPDIYLYGSLVHASDYLKDDPLPWASKYDSALAELIVSDERSQFQGTTPRMRGATIG